MMKQIHAKSSGPQAGLRPDSARSNVLAAENCEVRRTADVVGGKGWICHESLVNVKVADEQWITHGELDL